MPITTDDSARDLAQIILPDAESLRLDRVAIQDDTVVLSVSSTQLEPPCPLCGQPSSDVHSAYTRTPSDLALTSWRMRLCLTVRRFFCANPACQRKTFAERLPTVLKPYARRTNRLSDKLLGLAFALGGEPAARRSADLAIPVSPDTLLRLIRQAPQPAVTTPAVLGVDDFALRKGRTYGTILVDLEQHRVIDLLTDRTADTLADWLKAHPGVSVISRDRSGAYAEGARRGAPEAEQVADRFHLLQNLSDALKPFLSREHAHLPRITVPGGTALEVPAGQSTAEAADGVTALAQDPTTPATVGLAAASGPAESMPTRRLTRVEQTKQDRRQRRHARYDEVLALHAQGLSLRSIAKQTGLGRSTVRRFIRPGAFPEIRPRRKAPSILDQFAPYLLERWQAGCHNAGQLYDEICQRGYRGSKPLVRRFLAPLRQGLPKPARKSSDPMPSGQPTAGQGLFQRQISPSQAAWYMVCKPADLKPEQQSALEQMCENSPQIAQAYDLAQTFTEMVREHTANGLGAWLERVGRCCVKELRSLGRGIQQDLAAVTAGLSTPVSNGQVEGQVNRLKWLKRSMFGRANFDLLKRRVLTPT